MSYGKLFAPDDHAIIILLIKNVLPTADTNKEVRWLREVITSYHGWYGFFNHEKTLPSNLYKHHNYLSKVVAKKKQLVDVINRRDTGYIESRERQSEDLRIALFEFGKLQPQFSSVQMEIILFVVAQNKQSLTSLYFSPDVAMRVHYYFVIGAIYHSLLSDWCNKKSTSTLFYEFAGIVERVITIQTPNDEDKVWTPESQCLYESVIDQGTSTEC